MSGNATLPAPDAAYNTLYEGIHAEVFFQKCAAAGYVPRTADEARVMLETAGQLRLLEGQRQEKMAQDSPYHLLNQMVGQVLDQHGISAPVKQAEAESAIQQIADVLAQDPRYYNSVLSLKCAEAEELNAQYQQWRQQQGQAA
jgi:hypothetical protein